MNSIHIVHIAVLAAFLGFAAARLLHIWLTYRLALLDEQVGLQRRSLNAARAWAWGTQVGLVGGAGWALGGSPGWALAVMVPAALALGLPVRRIPLVHWIPDFALSLSWVISGGLVMSAALGTG